MFNSDNLNQQQAFPQDLPESVCNWLSHQLSHINQSVGIRKNSSQQQLVMRVFEGSFLTKFLLKVNFEYFSRTEIMDLGQANVSMEIKTQRRSRIIAILQRYVEYSEGKRLVDRFKRRLQLQSQQSINNTSKKSHHFILLLLFISLRSQNNSEFIQRILNLPLQEQQEIMNTIIAFEENLQKMTEKEQLIIKFNELKQINQQLEDYHENLLNVNEKLRQNSGNAIFCRQVMEKRMTEVMKDKLHVCQQLNRTDTQMPYINIFRSAQQQNVHLQRLLLQKQRKHEQLDESHSGLKNKLDQFEDVLYELKDQKKKLKVILNDKKNESFLLEMKASLRISNGENVWRQRRKTVIERRVGLEGAITDRSGVDRLSGIGNSWNNFIENNLSMSVNQSVNMLGKIEELKLQKQALLKELTGLKSQNKKLRMKQVNKQNTFFELSQVYNECLALMSDIAPESKNPLTRERSKTGIKTVSNRYARISKPRVTKRLKGVNPQYGIA